MKPRISATRFLLDEQIDALVAKCTNKKEFVLCSRALAQADYMLPIVVLQFCFDRG